MSQVWHLFRNDLRASKYLLTVWFGALAAYLAAAWQDPLTVEANIHASTIGALTMVVAAVVAAMLVQQDSLVSVRSFWMTRPIGRWSLLGAKLLFVGVFLVGAQLIACSALLYRFGTPIADVPAIALTISGAWIWILAMAVMLATVTAGAAEFISASLIVHVGAVLGVIAVASLLYPVRYSNDYFVVGALFACAALIPLRYAGLSRRKTFATLAACWAGLILLPLTGWAPTAENEQRADKPPAGLILRAGLMSPSDEGYRTAFPSGDHIHVQGFMVLWEADGLEPDQVLRLETLQGSISWEDGTETQVRAQTQVRLWGAGPISTMDFSGQGDRAISRVILDEVDDMETIYGKRGRLRARFTGRLQQLKEYESLPVESGAMVEGDGYAIRIASVSLDADKAAISFRERRIADTASRADWPRPIIIRRHTGTKLFQSGPARVDASAQGPAFGWPVLGIRQHDAVYEWRTQASEIASSGPEWLKGAEFTVIGYAPERKVALEVEIPDFRVIPNDGTMRR